MKNADGVCINSICINESMTYFEEADEKRKSNFKVIPEFSFPFFIIFNFKNIEYPNLE